MQGVLSRASLDQSRCLFCAFRLSRGRNRPIFDSAVSRRAIQTSPPLTRPAQATASATPENDPEDEAQIKRQRPSWGIRGEPKLRRATERIISSDATGPNVQVRSSISPAPDRETQDSDGRLEISRSPEPNRNFTKGPGLKISYHGVGPPIDKKTQPTSTEENSNYHKSGSSGYRNTQTPSTELESNAGFRRLHLESNRQESTSSHQKVGAQPSSWKHVNLNSSRPAVSEPSPSHPPPDPWKLKIPRQQEPDTPFSDFRGTGLSTGVDTASGKPFNGDGGRSAGKESPYRAQREAYREERADKSDRYHRIKDRQQSNTASKYGRRRGAFDRDEEISAATADRIEAKRLRKAKRRSQNYQVAPTPITLPDFISVGNLARALKVRMEKFTNKLQELGFDEISVDHIVDAETAGLVASEFNFEPTLPKEDVDEDLTALPIPQDKSSLSTRPPVITIMGHVDHGKTTILDWLRKSSVVESEHGGITQHIGAFTVPMPSGRVITFLDTPGHAAFLSMRARGANVTDIVILVVAADDSVKPQTIEAINHAKEAQVPIIVAINKIDKPEADPQRVKNDLARHGVEVEDFGGEVQTVAVSGKTGEGMEDLEEAALALADILDARAPADGPVEGWVLESSAKRAGKVATVLVRRGTLTPGAVLVAGTTWARVRTLQDANSTAVPSAGPGVPVLVDGWREQPEAGDEALEAVDEQRAKRAIAFRQEREESARMAQDVGARNKARSEDLAAEAARAQAEADGEDKATLEEAAAQKKAQEQSGVLELPIVLRADVSGSVEALDAYIQTLASPLIRPNVLRALVGPATPSDVRLADLTGGVLVSFNVAVPSVQSQAAERASVPVLTGNVIYQLVDAVKAAMEIRLPEKVITRVLGEAEVLQIFHIGLGGGRGKLPVAGVRIGNGMLKQGGRVRVLRGGRLDAEASDLGAGRKGARRSEKNAANAAEDKETVIYDGTIATLRSQKKEVPEMRKGTECGLSFDGGFSAFEPGDRVQYYEETREKQKL